MQNLPKPFIEALKKGRYDIPFFSEYFCNKTLHPGQVKWFENSADTLENLMHAGNRWGKSVVIAIKHLHRLIYKIRDPKWAHIKHYNSVNVSITMEQAKIPFTEIERIFEESPKLRWCLAKPPVHKPFPLMKFGNGSEFTVRSTDQPRNLWGPWYDFISFDEPAYENRPADTIPLLRTRTLDHNGMIDYMGTPASRKNWYYSLYQEMVNKIRRGIPGFYVQGGKTEENPNVSKEAIARMKETMTLQQVKIFLEGRFIDAGGAVFGHDFVERAINTSITINQPAVPGHFYVDGWDIATKKDSLVGITIDLTSRPMRVVHYEEFFAPISWELVYEKIQERHRKYNSIPVVDTTCIGDHIPSQLSEVPIIPVVLNKYTKPAIIINAQKVFEKGNIEYPYIKGLIDQLLFYDWDDGKLKTDAVLALVIALSCPVVSDQNLSIDKLVKLGSDSSAEKIKDGLLSKMGRPLAYYG